MVNESVQITILGFKQSNRLNQEKKQRVQAHGKHFDKTHEKAERRTNGVGFRKGHLEALSRRPRIPMGFDVNSVEGSDAIGAVTLSKLCWES